jgi:hypothetical protein
MRTKEQQKLWCHREECFQTNTKRDTKQTAIYATLCASPLSFRPILSFSQKNQEWLNSKWILSLKSIVEINRDREGIKEKVGPKKRGAFRD